MTAEESMAYLLRLFRLSARAEEGSVLARSLPGEAVRVGSDAPADRSCMVLTDICFAPHFSHVSSTCRASPDLRSARRPYRQWERQALLT